MGLSNITTSEDEYIRQALKIKFLFHEKVFLTFQQQDSAEKKVREKCAKLNDEYKQILKVEKCCAAYLLKRDLLQEYKDFFSERYQYTPENYNTKYLEYIEEKFVRPFSKNFNALAESGELKLCMITLQYTPDFD